MTLSVGVATGGELGVVQAQFALDGDADDGKNRPDRETGSEMVLRPRARF